MSALSTESSVESRARARLIRLLIVPTGVSQMAAASSWEKPDAPTRRFALARRQRLERPADFLEFQLAVLLGR